MENIEYKIEKDKDFIGKRYESYTVEKKITYDNGKVEHRYRTVFPYIDGDIDKIDLDTLDFPKTITHEEWEKLSLEYHKAWLNGTMTEKLCKELENLRVREGVV